MHGPTTMISDTLGCLSYIIVSHEMTYEPINSTNNWPNLHQKLQQVCNNFAHNLHYDITETNRSKLCDEFRLFFLWDKANKGSIHTFRHPLCLKDLFYKFCDSQPHPWSELVKEDCRNPIQSWSLISSKLEGYNPNFLVGDHPVQPPEAVSSQLMKSSLCFIPCYPTLFGV